jgi:trans-aconitate methyltransferase
MTWNAGDYSQNSSAQFQWALPLVEMLKLEGHERILDVGCGDGKITALLAERVPRGHVVGIDHSEAMVDFASKSFVKDNLRFALGDAADLPFASEFDVVFSNATLHWLRNPLPALQGMQRALVIGGRAVMQMGGKGNAASILGVLQGLAKTDPWKALDIPLPYGFYGPDEYADWLAIAGLRPVRLELVPKDMCHDNRHGLEGWLRSTWHPYVERVEPSRRDELVGTIVTKYLKAHPLDADGRTHVTMVRMEVEATKGA